MDVQHRPIDEVKPYDGNPRIIPKKAVQSVMASIRDFGFRQPIVVDGDGVVIVGHTRLLAAKELGMDTVPVHVAADMAPERVRQYRLADNKTGELSSWHRKMLLEEIGLAGGEFLETYGFGSHDFTDIGMWKPDNRLESTTATDIQPGDILEFDGGHRLRCGSSLDEDARDGLLEARLPHLCVTDPPYGVGYDRKHRRGVGYEGGLPKGYDDDKLAFGDYLAAVSLPCIDVAFVWHGGTQAPQFAVLLGEDGGFDYRHHIVWLKNRTVQGRGRIDYRHEPCAMLVRRGRQMHWQGGKRETSAFCPDGDDWWPLDSDVLFEAQPPLKYDHPAQKPIECMARPMRWCSKRGDLVWEPFSGSGTTLFAAHRTGRVFLGMELSPGFCETARRRWIDAGLPTPVRASA